MPTPLHALLLLSDDGRIARVVAALRGAGYDVRAGYAATDRALRAALAQRRWDVVIGDVRRPDGLTAAAAARAPVATLAGLCPDMPPPPLPPSPAALAAAAAWASSPIRYCFTEPFVWRSNVAI